MGRLTRLSTRTTAAAAGALLLAGGIAGPALASGQASEAATSSSAASDCGLETGHQAAQRWIPVLIPPFGADHEDQGAWDAKNVDTSTYDQCAELSWITVQTEGATASSPSTIMLFHKGAYLGTATNGSFGFAPDVARVDDSTLDVTFHYPQAGDSNADPRGQATSTYSWDQATGTLTQEGQLPPHLNS